MDRPSADHAGAPSSSKRIGDDPSVRSVRPHHVEKRPPILPEGEGNISSIGRDGRSSEELGPFAAPEFGAAPVRKPPKTLVRACLRDIEKEVRTQPRREPCAGGQRDLNRLRYFLVGSVHRHAPQGPRRTCDRGHETATIRVRGQRGVQFGAGGELVRDAALDVHGVKPRT